MPRNKKVAIISDLHCGHRAGLTPPKWRFRECSDEHIWKKFTAIQDEAWKLYVSEIKAIGPVDCLIVNGDCIDGRGERSGGVELITGDRNEQCKIAIDCIKAWKTQLTVITRGTAYHVGDVESWEDLIATEIGAKIGDHEWVDVNGFVFDCKHHVGSSQIPHGRFTAQARDDLWNIIWSEADLQPTASMIVRCLSSDTEVLTQRGWHGYLTIRDTDTVATMNTQSGKIEWQPIRAFTWNRSYKEMVQIKAKGVDALVTPDHSIYYKSQIGNEFLHREAKSYASLSASRLPVSGSMCNHEVDLSLDMIRLLAWVIAEGNMDSGNASKGYIAKNNVRLFQRGSQLHRITDILDRLGISYTKHERHDAGQVINDDTGVQYTTKENTWVVYIRQPNSKSIIQMLDGSKNIPDWMMNMGGEQFEAFLDAYVEGDGHADGDGKYKSGKVFTANKDLADRLQSLLIRNGYKSQVSPRAKWGRLNYVVCYTRKSFVNIRKQHCAIVPYSGVTWCISTDNGTLVTRRNGKSCVVGNSHVHYYAGTFSYATGKRREAITTPALQCMGTRFGARRCSGMVNWGVLAFEINTKGQIAWRHEGIHQLAATKATAVLA